MSTLLYQMNSVTAPTRSENEPLRQIRNYFNLLKNFGKLGLLLAIEKKYGFKLFDGIANNAQASAIYDDIILSVMRPDEFVSDYFYPEEVDAIAETFSKNNLKLARGMDYLRTLIASRMERQMLEVECEGDTHVPTINWVSQGASDITHA